MDPTRVAWRTSTKSGSSGNCVEVATPALVVMVRDSKNRQGPVLWFSPSAWSTFIATVKR
ncbi:hypothetical protein TPA0907_38860 [Micromonospora humidisoli]|uniref:DUF397 domain-containing protein n=1 Tax=Micromonospora sp. AKA109 TaxID=2733865 RepID=UPI0022BAB458|nr:DUF397 domain-containing protein [Micromonospora sp. AKA109]GHJ09519.1 hypothetical protein TPA0907_38860 [Micromonospora sp. AKA109]